MSSTAFLRRSMIGGVSMPRDMISSMYPSTVRSVGWIGTRSGAASAYGTLSGNVLIGRLSMNVLYGEWISDGSHVSSSIIHFDRSTMISVTMLNMLGAGDEPKGSRIRIYAMALMMVMQLRAACQDVWRRR